MNLVHSVYTRCKYPREVEVRKRMLLTVQYTAPAMSQQQVDATWIWLCNKEHEEIIQEAVRLGGYTGPLVFNVNQADGYEDIQTTLDSDDLIAPGFLTRVQELYRSGETYIRYWHPIRLAHASGHWYKPSRIANWPSMFYSVYNPTSRVHVYCGNHTRLDKETGVPVLPVDGQDQVVLVVHGSNIHTTIKKGDIRIKRPDTFA